MRQIIDPVLFEDGSLEPPNPKQTKRWSISSLRTFRNCPRMWYWQYVLGLRIRKPVTPLVIGSVFHAGLEEWIVSSDPMEKIASRLVAKAEKEAAESEALFDQAEYDKFLAELMAAEGMLLGYEVVYEKDREDMSQLVYPEAWFEVEFEPPYENMLLVGKIDLATEVSKGKYRIWEHKTASQLSGSYIERLSMDSQVRAYIYGAKWGLNLTVKDVVYNVTRKCRLRRKSNEKRRDYLKRIRDDYFNRPDFYFWREVLVFSSKDLEAFERDLILTQEAREFFMQDLSLDWGLPESWYCNDRMCDNYGMCSYFPICRSGLDKGSMHLYYQKGS